MLKLYMSGNLNVYNIVHNIILYICNLKYIEGKSFLMHFANNIQNLSKLHLIYFLNNNMHMK